MKKLDKLLLNSFIGPFLVSFGIALFVLIMQFLWLYIDEIAGKGVSIFIMLELIGYLSVSTFPMALPIGVLIASVMVLGNMAERYELSSIKSAGVSLMRVLLPLTFVCSGIAMFSYVCSDFLIPYANLKFRSRLFDIRKQKPALSIEQGTFNDDFRQFIIRVGEKEKDGETIKNVIIEDQTATGRTKFNQILSDSGQMFTSADKRFFVMNLFNGAQYQEPTPPMNQKKQKYPFIRTNFRTWSKVWDMQEFEMTMTDEERFKAQRSMLSISQLQKSIDSLNALMDSGRQEIATDMLINLKKGPMKTPDQAPVSAITDTSKPAPQKGQSSSILGKPQDNEAIRRKLGLKDDKNNNRAASATSQTTGQPDIPSRPPPDKKDFQAPTPAPSPPFPPGMPMQELKKGVSEYKSLLETFDPKFHSTILKDADRQIKLAVTNIENRKSQIATRNLEAVKTGYELYIKYSFALVCLIFLFIGAPMGALIRKGGFGYPILVSIIFFVVFIFLTILFRKLAESYILTPFWAAMMPCLVMSPIALFLTRRAMNDAQLFSTERLERWITGIAKIFQRKRKLRTTSSPEA